MENVLSFLKEGDMGICGVAVLMFFLCGDAVNKISTCGDIKPYGVRCL